MATSEKGILGGFSGKVGTVIGSSWNGVEYMRGNPGQIVNPQTEAQQNQRAKVALVIKFLSPLKAFLHEGFKKQAQRMTAFNAAMSWNLTHAVTGTYPFYEIDYAKAMLSQGKLPAAFNPRVTSPASGQVEFSWQDNSGQMGAMPDDRALLVVYHPEKKKAFTVMEGSFRAEEHKIITLPPDFQGAEVHGYISFQNARQTMISDSSYAGVTVVG